VNKHRLDLATWPRRDHFRFFRNFDEPFFGIVVELECQGAYDRARDLGVPFFLYYLHCSLQAANAVEAFRYRLEDDEVMCYDVVHASPTVNRPDGTFGFSYMTFYPDLAEFIEHARAEVERVRATTGLETAAPNANIIHYSVLPWLKFTSLSHARHFGFNDSIPKISFGKLSEEAGGRRMPMSVHAHHALVDGYHVGQYVEGLTKLLGS
jgi:chloramphenicol O-acetyltransferase type A